MMEPVERDKRVQDFLCDLSEELGDQWKHIGRRLGLMEPTLENIDKDHHSQSERGLQMLLRWRQENGVTNLCQTLDEGLRKARRVDLAEKFVPRLKDILSQADMPTGPTNVSNRNEQDIVKQLKQFYIRRNKVPLIPWAGKNGKVVTVELGTVYTNLELLIDIDNPDLPLRYPLKLEKLFDEVRAENMSGVQLADSAQVEERDRDDEPGSDDKGERLSISSCRVVGRGRTGSGKTTLLLKMVSDWADQRKGPLKNAKAVFLLLLRKLDNKSNLGDAIKDQLLPDASAEFIEEYIQINQDDVVILLDGYDEFKGKGLRRGDCGNIVKMLRNECYPKVRVFVTTRPGRVGDFLGLEDDITDDYRHLHITGFSSSDIDAYIEKILKSRPELAKKLVNYLEENHLKMELASLPLMCCAFCQLTKYTNGKNFKDMNTISALFDKLIQCLMRYHPKSKEQKSIPPDAADVAVEVENDRLLIELGKVALQGFFRSQEEELIFSRKDFKECKPGPDEVIAKGCRTGILYCDGEVEYRPVSYEDLEINNNMNDDFAHSFNFVLKIFQEKLAGKYLAHLLHENMDHFQMHVQSITHIQRAIDLGNVLMFACGANRDAAREIMRRVIDLLKPDAHKIWSFMKGNLHYSECQRVQRLVEFCFQLNYESQSKGQFNVILKDLMSGSDRLRLVGMSSYVTKCLGYFLEHSKGVSITSLELIRLHLNSSTEFREFLNTFPGLDEHVSTSMNRKRRKKKGTRADPLREEKRKEKLRDEISRNQDIPKYLTQRSDDVFMTVAPLWQRISKMQMSEWNFGPIIKGLQHCPVQELILSGVKAEVTDWQRLFAIIQDPSFNCLQKLTLSMTDMDDELLAELVPAICTQDNLTYLKLSGNEVGLDFMDAFKTDSQLKMLETLILDKTDMDSETMDELGSKLRCFPSLRKLDVRRNEGSTNTSIGSIIDNVQHCPKLETLMISLHEVTKEPLLKLNEKMNIVSQLRELHLVHTPDPETVMQCVSQTLQAMSALEDLRISATPPDETKTKHRGQEATVSYETTQRFSDAVVKSTQLRFVSILYATMESKSFLYLLKSCREATANGLQTLRFSSAYIPKDEDVLRPVREAEKLFLRIWV